jgi:hypothetical protein
MIIDVASYLDGLEKLVVQPDIYGNYPSPKKTEGLTRMFNRAIAQALFSGRRQIDIIDLYQSMYRKQIVMPATSY